MSVTLTTLALLFLGQVPPPLSAADRSANLRAELRTIQANEAEALQALAAKLQAAGQAEQAAGVLAKLQPEPAQLGASRFEPLPEIVPAAKGLANVAAGAGPAAATLREAAAARSRVASSLFELAKKALEQKHFALADECLRGVLARQPDHAEARRLLGFVQHEGGWATPYAASNLKKGELPHKTFGWVPADWVPHLDKGELPGPVRSRGEKPRWLPTDEADALRQEFKAGWHIYTEHFHIQTNVPMAEAIAFGRKLEAFHDLFFSLLADVIGSELPLAQRFRNAKLQPRPANPDKRHVVYYFADKGEYADFLEPYYGESVSETLGIYMTPNEAKLWHIPARSYFFRDKNGQIDGVATLYHEVSHQLLFESAGKTNYEQNPSDFWVFEGLGTYFESVESQPNGTLEFGGLSGARITAFGDRLASRAQILPLEQFVAMNRARFSNLEEGEIHFRYAEAMALTIFLMQAESARYRDDFLEYVDAAYHGRLRRGIGRSLEDRLGVPLKTLEKQFVDYIAQGLKPRAK